MHTQGPRERLLFSAITLMCRHGVHATGLAELLAHSHTARGSIYQHFPGGKSDLMQQATFTAGRTIDALLDTLLAAGDPAAALDGVIEYWKQVLLGSDFEMGCPILAAAQAGPEEPGLRAASATVFAGWITKITTALIALDSPPDLARSTASTAVSAIEGAIAQARSAHSTQPLDDVRLALTHLVAVTAPVR